MTLAKNLYDILVEVLEDTDELPSEAGLLQSDRAIAERFNVSESTSRNWRRGKHGQLAPATMNSIIHVCQEIAPERVPDLEFIDRLSRDAHSVRIAAETLVEELNDRIHTDKTSWHIYSGPLKMAFDVTVDSDERQRLMTRSSVLVRRLLEMGIDQANIPAAPELIRYSTHGWYLGGQFKIREESLRSEIAGILDGYLSSIEAALYIGDGCAIPSLLSGDAARASMYIDQALNLLANTSRDDEKYAGVSLEDASTMIRSLQAMVACYSGDVHQQALIEQFVQDYENRPADNEWIEGHRHETLGYVNLTRTIDYAKAAHHFANAADSMNHWLGHFDIPFSSTSAQSLCGYALLMSEGPTEKAKSQISEGLVHTIDLGIIPCRIRARMVQARFYECSGDTSMANYQRNKINALVHKHKLHNWYAMIERILPPTIEPVA